VRQEVGLGKSQKAPFAFTAAGLPVTLASEYHVQHLLVLQDVRATHSEALCACCRTNTDAFPPTSVCSKTALRLVNGRIHLVTQASQPSSLNSQSATTLTRQRCQKKQTQLAALARDIANLLASGKFDSARIRVRGRVVSLHAIAVLLCRWASFPGGGPVTGGTAGCCVRDPRPVS